MIVTILLVATHQIARDHRFSIGWIQGIEVEEAQQGGWEEQEEEQEAISHYIIFDASSSGNTPPHIGLVHGPSPTQNRLAGPNTRPTTTPNTSP